MNRSPLSLRPSIISAYLFTETLVNFGLCLFVFTLTALMSQIFRLTELLINKGLSVREIASLILYFLPSLLYLVMPLSLLMAILITLGRMSSDGEMLAFKASGVSLGRLFRPIMVVTLAAYLLTTFFTVYLSPEATYSLKKLIYDIARTKAEIGLKARIFNTDFNKLMIYVNEIAPQTHRLKGVFISDSREGEDSSTIIAEDGYFVSNPEKLELTLFLKNGSIHRLSRKTSTYQKIDFGSYNLSLNLEASEQGSAERKKKEELSTPELLTVAATQQSGDEYYPLLVEYYSRFAIPFACIVFGLVAVPLGVYSPRTGRAYGFVIGLVTVVAYYLLFSLAKNIGSTGLIPPAAAVWAPNILFLLLAGYLFKKGQSESRIPALEQSARLWEMGSRKLSLIMRGSDEKAHIALSILEDLNTNSRQALMIELGIDQSLAENIIAYRLTHGGLRTFEDLKNVPGISQAVFDKIKENVFDAW